ncbi:MAG TPA: OmpA family protein [Bryobacteraceae bacterium]|nr:OmpA family protein [Bryobacteraceae bacterium]
MADEIQGNGHASGNAFAELRTLLVGPEREQLADIRRRLDDPARWLQDLSRVLPEAIRLRRDDRKLRLALHPIIEESIRVSVQRDPRMLADALHPVIGAAVRKAVASALQSMLLSLNQVMEQSVSLRSIRWRFEAWRTGKSFGEILLLRSLLYRVEQVFLIHRKTGLLLLHREASAAVVKDADLVSGMLTAIQDFVRDSFGAPESAQLETVQVGEFSVWIQHGPQAILAGVIRGAAPSQLQTVFQDALWHIGTERAADLEQFNGDASPFAACAPDLDKCLLGQAQQAPKPASVLLWIVPALVVLALGIWLFFSIRDQRRWDAYVHNLSRQPGIVVTTAARRGGHYLVTGLRDPLAADASALLAASGIPADRVSFEWEPYRSSQPRFAAVREWEAGRDAIQHEALYFATDQSRITPEQLNAIGTLAAGMRDLFRQSDAMAKTVSIEVIGHTDDSGTEQRNDTLARERADHVIAALVSEGVPVARLSSRGASAGEVLRPGSSDTDRAVNRAVTFRVAGAP